MTEGFSRDRLQPALLDRLVDNISGIGAEIARRRELLLPLLDDRQKHALARVGDPERSGLHAPTADELEPFASLEGDARGLLDGLLELERLRVFEARQQLMISRERLKELVLRDLGYLFNTECFVFTPLRLTAEAVDHPPSLDDFPLARRSVVNYGLPSLAGKVGSDMDLEALGREVAEIIRTFEPRLRDPIRVRAIYDPEKAAPNTLSFEIEAELWAQPMPLRLLLRALVDLEDGQASVVERAAA
jgi:type VI secretion system protein ImpF